MLALAELPHLDLQASESSRSDCHWWSEAEKMMSAMRRMTNEIVPVVPKTMLLHLFDLQHAGTDEPTRFAMPLMKTVQHMQQPRWQQMVPEQKHVTTRPIASVMVVQIEACHDCLPSGVLCSPLQQLSPQPPLPMPMPQPLPSP